MSKPLNQTVILLAAVVTVVSGIAAYMAYFKGAAPGEIRAEGQSMVATDGSTIVRREERNQYDFDAKTREEAESYQSVARNTCGQLSARTEAYTVDSVLNPHLIAQFMPMELEPNESVAEFFGEDAHSEIRSRLGRIDQLSRPVMSVMTHNMVAGTLGRPSKSKKAAAARESFGANKEILLQQIRDLCGYLADLKRSMP
jgi:hypothetical protein